MKKLFLFCAALLIAAVSMAQTPTVSASSVTLKYCLTTYSTVHVPAKQSMLPLSYDGFTFPDFGTYVRKKVNARGCDSVVTYIVEVNTEGVLPGGFTVNGSGGKVHFAKGNLMYRASNGTAYPNAGCLSHNTATGTAAGLWKFADTQYASCGDITANSDPQQNQTAWMDVFSFGCSGYNNYKPTSRSSYPSGSTVAGTNYDWGVFNAIQGGGNLPGLWRSLTRAEWDYIYSSRPNASSKWAFGTINGIKGMFLLPDEWVTPAGCTWTAQSKYLSYTLAQWAKMEENGAVFLITDYYSQSSSASSMSGNGQETIYRTADNGVNIYWDRYSTSFYADQDDACHIRLVCDY